jgi:hypothetical protein
VLLSGKSDSASRYPAARQVFTGGRARLTRLSCAVEKSVEIDLSGSLDANTTDE